MKLLRFIALLLVPAVAAALPAAAASASPPAAPATAPAPKQSVANPLAPRFKQVRERIDALFLHRNAPLAPLDPKHNPFRLPGTRPVAPVPEGVVAEDAAPALPADNLAQLQQATATLKVSGVFEKGGRAHLVINARPYQQGDVVQTLVQGEKVYLRVKDISKRSVTLALHDAELTLKF